MAPLGSLRTAVRCQLANTRTQARVGLSNPAVRRVHLALGANQAAEWAYFTALEVFAFEVGGAFAVGLVGVLSELPSAVAAPLTSLLGDRFRRERLLFGLAVLRSVELCAAALASSRGAPPGIFYGLLAFDSILASAVFPNQQGLLPRLTRNRAELATSAALTAMVETVGGGIGPVIGGVLLATTNLSVVYAFSAAMLLSSGFLFLSAHRRRPATASSTSQLPPAAPLTSAPPRVGPAGSSSPPPDSGSLEEEEPSGLIGDLVDGLRALRDLKDVRLLLILFAVDGFMEGALDVFVIVLALKVLGIGAEGVGALAAVETVGGVIGGLFALNAVRVRGLGVRWTLMGLADAVPPIVLAAYPALGVVIVALFAWEGIDTLDEGIGLELLRRVVPPPLMSQALGLEDSVVTLSIAAGSVASPVLVVFLGVRGGLLAIGLAAPILVLATLRGMRRIDLRTGIAPAAD